MPPPPSADPTLVIPVPASSRVQPRLHDVPIEIQPRFLAVRLEAGTVEGIRLAKAVRPAPVKRQHFFVGNQRRPAATLPMAQRGPRLTDYLVARLKGSQAKVHVIVIQGEPYVESTQLFE